MPRGRSAVQRLRLVYKRHGLAGLLRIPRNRLLALREARRLRGERGPADHGLRVEVVDSFHSDEGARVLRELDADLGVVDGTYVLKERAFNAPRFGCVNLHCGKLPEYRGAPPCFWELYNGERQVGVTVHRVTERLDEGPILSQRMVPLEPATGEDPMAYIRRVWQEVQRPLGIEMLGQVAAAIRAGAASETPQTGGPHPTYKFPDRHAVRELRRRVRARRAG
jgi:methionyl-tRNA formyltransferase